MFMIYFQKYLFCIFTGLLSIYDLYNIFYITFLESNVKYISILTALWVTLHIYIH